MRGIAFPNVRKDPPVDTYIFGAGTVKHLVSALDVYPFCHNDCKRKKKAPGLGKEGETRSDRGQYY